MEERPLYLSQGWLDASREALNSSELVRVAGRGEFSAVFQHYVTDLPPGYGTDVVSFYSEFRDGKALRIQVGEADSPEFTFTGPYSVWKRIHKAEKGIATSVLTRKLGMKADPWMAFKTGARYRKMLAMNGVVASVPTEFLD